MLMSNWSSHSLRILSPSTLSRNFSLKTVECSKLGFLALRTELRSITMNEWSDLVVEKVVIWLCSDAPPHLHILLPLEIELSGIIN